MKAPTIYSRLAVKLLIFGFLGVLLVSSSYGEAATSTIPTTGAIDLVVQSSITANDLKPPECDVLNLQNIILGEGAFSGTPDNDLILGSANADAIDGLAGDDCILGGPGDDQLLGGVGTSGTQTVLDQFNAISYANNDGSQDWAGDWQELGESNGPAYGDVNVEVPLGRGVYTLYTNQDTHIEEKNPNNNYGSDDESKVKGQTGDLKRSLFRFNLASIPTGSNVLSARVYFFVKSTVSDPVSIHRITSAWIETGATWSNSAAGFDPTSSGSFTPSTNNQFVSANLTALVQQWVNGSVPNQGLMLIATTTAGESKYSTKEANGITQDPYLVVEISQGGGAQTTYSNMDTHIEEKNPSNNYGTDKENKVSRKTGDNKRSLFRFDLAMIPAGSNIASASTNLYVTSSNNSPVYIHRITADWTETGATWNNISSAFAPSASASFTPSSNNQYYSIGITALVQQWVNGTYPNQGLGLIGTLDAGESKYASKEEDGSVKDPYLTIVIAPGGPLQALRIQNASKGAWRQIDLSNALSTQLEFNYLRRGLDDANDFVRLEVSNNGGGSWTELARFSGPATDSQFLTASYDISSYRAGNTQIRFLSSGTLAVDDRVYFDNIKITYVAASPAGNTDVLLGGAGDDTLDGGPGEDFCHGGDGSDIFVNCEWIFDP